MKCECTYKIISINRKINCVLSKKKEKCDTDKNEYKKSYRPCIQQWKFITMQTKQLKNIIYQVITIIMFFKLSIISLDIINCYESTAPNIGE